WVCRWTWCAWIRYVWPVILSEWYGSSTSHWLTQRRLMCCTSASWPEALGSRCCCRELAATTCSPGIDATWRCATSGCGAGCRRSREEDWVGGRGGWTSVPGLGAGWHGCSLGRITRETRGS